MLKIVIRFVLERLVGFHYHNWSEWKNWGYTYNERRCKTCGWRQVR